MPANHSILVGVRRAMVSTYLGNLSYRSLVPLFRKPAHRAAKTATAIIIILLGALMDQKKLDVKPFSFTSAR